MASAPLLIVVDDKRTDSIFFGPKDWNTSTLTPWFNGTEQVPSFASKGSNQFGTIFMKFQGTSVAFFGITPSAFNGSQILSVSIDGSQPTNTSYDDPNPPSYRQWYQSPTLPQGSHQISLGHLAGTSLDFAVVAVGQDTPLAGQLAIVDNEDPAFTFKGNWKQNKALFNSGQFPDGLPFHNSTQDSSTIGDQLTFRFTGQSAAIYGIFNWSNLGLITLTFTMDGSSLSRTFRVTTTTPQFQSRLGQQQNFQFFSYDFLSPGNHTLVVNVTDRVNQTFSFDYITFTPSFATLATRPNLTSLTDTASGDLSSSQSKLSPGAIAGIVISLIVVLLLGGVFFLRRRRLRKKTSEYNLINPFLPRRRDAETFPLNGPNISSSASIMSNDTMQNTVVSRYDPVYNDNVDAQPPAAVVVGGQRPTHTSVGSSSTLGSFYHHDDTTAAGGEGGLLSPPSYAESTRVAPVRPAVINPF